MTSEQETVLCVKVAEWRAYTVRIDLNAVGSHEELLRLESAQDLATACADDLEEFLDSFK